MIILYKYKETIMKKIRINVGVMLILPCCTFICTSMLYVCSNYPRCDAYVRTHPGTNIPVGTLANHELRTLRNQAHHYFDQLYLSGLMSKQDAYLWLVGLLQVPLSKAHIGFLGEYYCNEVIAESKKLLERRRKQQPAGFRPCKGGEAS